MEIEKNSWGYWQISFSDKEQHELKKKWDDVGYTHFKEGEEWVGRLSGMTFDLRGLDHYKEMKKYLNNELTIFLRKQKLEKINEI